jgi:hypothetical protein
LGILYKRKSVPIVVIEIRTMIKDLTIFSFGYLFKALVILATRKAIPEGMPKALWMAQLFTYHTLIVPMTKENEIGILNAIWNAPILGELIMRAVEKLKRYTLAKAVGAIQLEKSHIIFATGSLKASGLSKAKGFPLLAKRYLSLLDRKPAAGLEGIMNLAGEDIIADTQIIAARVTVSHQQKQCLKKRIALKKVVKDEIIQT